MDGVLIVDKPAGMTSHDVVDDIRRRLGTRKVGHGGTLDPDATGVLVLGIGRATRFLEYAQSAPKRYTAVGILGRSTSTQDASGTTLEERPVTATRDDVGEALGAFTGTIEQVPPMVSAVKIGGERLYAKARRGEEVERPARRVTIHELELKGFDRDDSTEPPDAEFELDVKCSGGTYVRTLVHDLGAALGCGGHLKTLRRTASGGFTLDEAVPLADVTEASLRPLGEIVRDLPRLEVDEATASLVANGRPLDAPVGWTDDLAAVVHGSDLLGVYRRKSAGRLLAEKVVPQ
jgi:tRNA pseudouridine55 synthase